MPKRKTSRVVPRKIETARDKQVDELIQALTRLAVVHEQAEKRREARDKKSEQRMDALLEQALPAILAQLGVKSKPNLRPVS